MSDNSHWDDDSTGNDESRQFRLYRNSDGSIEPLGAVRRNGVAVPRLSSQENSTNQPSRHSTLLQTYRELMQGLNSTERRIWVKLLLGLSVDEVAAMFGVSRAAIYSRIRGDRKGYKGLIAKSKNVAIWWDRRQGSKDDSCSSRNEARSVSHV
jgi:hypothetical protein